MEYAVYYLKQNGSLSKKVFQISQKSHKGYSQQTLQKSQYFKPLTTRKHYVGNHKISIIANGKEFDVIEFVLCESKSEHE